MKKILFIFLILIQQLFSSVIIDKEYNYEVFNMKLKNIPEIYTYEDISKALNDQYGFLLSTTIPELEGNKRFFKDNNIHVGDFITQIADNYEAVAEVNEKKGYIKLTQLYSTFAKFPYGWNLKETKEDLELNNPNISFKINANRIYAYGNKNQIEQISKILYNLEYITNKQRKFIIQIYTYTTDENDEEFIGYIKDNVNYDDSLHTLLLEKEIYLKNNEIIGFEFNDNFITIKLNIIKEELIFNSNYELSLNDFYSEGFIFTEKKDQIKNLWNNKKQKRKYIIQVKESQL